jgi:kynureninase
MAELVGARPEEVVLMNGVSVNAHLMMVPFYRPTQKRFKILMESQGFPSDRYIVQSQLEFHNIPVSEGLIEVKPREGEQLVQLEDILKVELFLIIIISHKVVRNPS